MTVLRAGGKFESDAYQVSGGSTVGVSVVERALSTRLEVDICRRPRVVPDLRSVGPELSSRVIQPRKPVGPFASGPIPMFRDHDLRLRDRCSAVAGNGVPQ